MSPEIKLLFNGFENELIDYNPEKCDIFSLGISFLRISLNLEESKIQGLNDKKKE